MTLQALESEAALAPQSPTDDEPVSLTDGQANALYRLGYNFSRHGQHEAASGLFALLMLKRPQEAKYALAVGICYRKLGRFEDAMWMFARAMQLAPEDHTPAFHIVECMGLLGRQDEASALLEAIVEAARREGNLSTLLRAEALLQFRNTPMQ